MSSPEVAALPFLGSRGGSDRVNPAGVPGADGRHATRAPIALAKVFVKKDGRIKLLTPVHPQTGKDYVIFDPLDWVHAVTTQIPDARQHLVRYQGAYANSARALPAQGGGGQRRVADAESRTCPGLPQSPILRCGPIGALVRRHLSPFFPPEGGQ